MPLLDQPASDDQPGLEVHCPLENLWRGDGQLDSGRIPCSSHLSLVEDHVGQKMQQAALFRRAAGGILWGDRRARGRDWSREKREICCANIPSNFGMIPSIFLDFFILPDFY